MGCNNVGYEWMKSKLILADSAGIPSGKLKEPKIRNSAAGILVQRENVPTARLNSTSHQRLLHIPTSTNTAQCYQHSQGQHY